jgi:hypothetical protein
MLIFSRTLHVSPGKEMEAVPYAVEVAARVTEITGHAISVYLHNYGPMNGALMWSTRMESQAELHVAQEKLAADTAYGAWIAEHAPLFTGHPLDRLVTVIAASNMTDTPRRFYSVLMATAANGKIAEAVEFGVRSQQFVADTLGLSTAFCGSVYGTWGEVGWLTGGDSMEDIDRLSAMQYTNADFQALVAESSDLFLASSGQSSLIQRLN